MIPISLYIHIPWCVRKCPYCDFNSHQSPAVRPEWDYVNALIADLDQDLLLHPAQTLHTIFIGGGTPSLISAPCYDYLFTEIKKRIAWSDAIEITLEANPGTIERGRFADYHAIGINRLSLGIQSFNANHLQKLGRIHDDRQAHDAIQQAQQAGFSNLNIDIMHSLPQQTLTEALADLQQAIQHAPAHISWYQLTLEPNTAFYRTKPELPHEDLTVDIEEAGFALLEDHHYQQYEISAFCQKDRMANHNLNYWLFGDYYGIGAGAHGKHSNPALDCISRTQKYRQPKDYLNPDKPYLTQHTRLDPKTLVFEFMLNVSRLQQMIPFPLFPARTGLSLEHLMPKLDIAAERGLIVYHPNGWQITPLGRRFTNDLQALFL
jgi:oxygen-independent coproporphyrinogen-3 oxidase